MKIFDLSQMAPNVPLESTRVLNWDLFQMTKHMTKHSRRDDVEYLIDDIIPLQKHAYSNILKILQLKKENFQIKNPDIFHISAQKHRLWVVVRTAPPGGSNDYPQSMFLSRNKKNNVYPCKPQFYYIKVVFKGVKII